MWLKQARPHHRLTHQRKKSNPRLKKASRRWYVISTSSQSPDSNVELAHAGHQQAGLTEKDNGNEYEGAGLPSDRSNDNGVDATLKEKDSPSYKHNLGKDLAEEAQG